MVELEDAKEKHYIKSTQPSYLPCRGRSRKISRGVFINVMEATNSCESAERNNAAASTMSSVTIKLENLF